MNRVKLPNRRRAITESIIWDGNRIHLRAGFDDAGDIKEIWISGGKVGSAFSSLTDEFAILMSRFLQEGKTPEDLCRMFGRLDDGKPASIAGAAADWLAGLRRFAA